MSGKLAAELRQSKPFASVEEEALLNLARTYGFIQQQMAEFFKQFQLTPTQYNILRILRGAGRDGVTCSQAAERMVTADPDVTRLLDRLERAGLARRSRLKQDRRVVQARITPKGLNLLAELDRPMIELIDRTLGHMPDARLKALIALLEEARKA